MEPTTLQDKGLEGKIYTHIINGTNHRVTNITYIDAPETPNTNGYPQIWKSITPLGSIGRPPRGRVKVQWQAMDPSFVTLVNTETGVEKTENYSKIVDPLVYKEVPPPIKATLAEKIATNFIDGNPIKGCHATIFKPTLSFQATNTGRSRLRDSLLHPHNLHKLQDFEWKIEWLRNKYGGE